MAGELERVASEFIEALDTRDRERLFANTDADVQSVDEITRRWLRGRDELEAPCGRYRSFRSVFDCEAITGRL
jgi:hypothetical protein